LQFINFLLLHLLAWLWRGLLLLFYTYIRAYTKVFYLYQASNFLPSKFILKSNFKLKKNAVDKVALIDFFLAVFFWPVKKKKKY